MPVDARRMIRKMRGGAQAHLLEASDGHSYVVKFANNPQHRRILVNEWVASVFLDYLGISTPKTTVVTVREDFLRENPDVFLQWGREHRAVIPGRHFGSRYPGDPARTVVYDFLPDSLLGSVENLAEFRGILAFDKWMGNADARQSIFFRARLKSWLPDSGASGPRLGFVAQMMDNGFVFDGPHWRLTESPMQGMYFRPLVYRAVRGWSDFEPWLERIRNFPEEVVDEAVKQIPEEWLRDESSQSDRDVLEQLLARLLERRKRVADLIESCRAGRADPFPHWRG